MRTTSDRGIPSEGTAPRLREEPHRNQYRARGWVIAIGASLLLWGVIATVVWAVGTVVS